MRGQSADVKGGALLWLSALLLPALYLGFMLAADKIMLSRQYDVSSQGGGQGAPVVDIASMAEAIKQTETGHGGAR